MAYSPAPTPPKIKFAELNVDKRHEPAERSETIVHGVDRAARRVGGDRRKQRGVGDAKTNFFSFHVAGRLIHGQTLHHRVGLALRQ